MEKALLIDFEDSFTRNIAAELADLGVDCRILSKDAIPGLVRAPSERRRVVILGPGPGCPQEHSWLYPSLRELGRDPGTMVLGICLGHQLWWAAHGAQVERGRPVHGRSFPLYIPEWDGLFPRSEWGKRVQVQRYNSLVVRPGPGQGPDCLGEAYVQGDLMMSYGRGFLTYQFHPESVGTSCPRTFFMPVRDFLYNVPHDRAQDIYPCSPT